MIMIFFFLFSYIASDFCFMYLCFFVIKCLMVYDIYLLCELYVLSLKTFIFVSLKKKKLTLGWRETGVYGGRPQDFCSLADPVLCRRAGRLAVD